VWQISTISSRAEERRSTKELLSSMRHSTSFPFLRTAKLAQNGSSPWRTHIIASSVWRFCDYMSWRDYSCRRGSSNPMSVVYRSKDPVPWVPKFSLLSWQSPVTSKVINNCERYFNCHGAITWLKGKEWKVISSLEAKHRQRLADCSTNLSVSLTTMNVDLMFPKIRVWACYNPLSTSLIS